MSQGKPPPTPVLDEIVDQILRGERVVLFPPGTLAFVAVCMGLLIGSALLCTIALPSLLGDALPHAAVAPLIGIGAALLSLVVPALLVAHGFVAGRRAFQGVTIAWLALAALALLAAAAGALPVASLTLCAPLLLLAGTVFITRSLAWAGFVHFKQRLRTRRGELLRERGRHG